MGYFRAFFEASCSERGPYFLNRANFEASSIVADTRKKAMGNPLFISWSIHGVVSMLELLSVLVTPGKMVIVSE